MGSQEASGVEGSGFEQFVRTHTSYLVRYAYLLTGDSQEAEDLTQDTLLKVLRNWSRVIGARAPRAYALRIMVNQNLDRVRSAQDPAASIADPAVIAHVDNSLQAAEDAMVLQRLLAQLHPRQRTAVVLRFYGDHSHEQIAELMQIKPATARSTLARALTALRAAAAADDAQLPPPEESTPNGAPR